MNRFMKLVNPNNVRRFSSTNIYLSEVQYLTRPNGNKVAYRQNVSDNLDSVGVVFCSGFQSNMQGVKAVALENYCKSSNLPFVRFDYQGCGDSTGNLRDMTISDWKSDVMAVLDQLTAGPQIMVGSSLGGLLMIHAALARPTRMKALIGIATAADLPERRFSNLPPEVLDEVKETGECVYSTDQHQYVLTQKLLDDAPKHSILSKEKIAINVPVKLLHGMRDESVSYAVSLELARKLQTSYVSINVSKPTDHRFSQPEDLKLIFDAMNELVEDSKDVTNLAIRSFASFSRYSHVKPSDMLERSKANRRARLS